MPDFGADRTDLRSGSAVDPSLFLEDHGPDYASFQIFENRGDRSPSKTESSAVSAAIDLFADLIQPAYRSCLRAMP